MNSNLSVGDQVPIFPEQAVKIMQFPCECAKINGLEPYAYLRYVFTELPKAGTVEVIEALLPGNLDMDQIKTG